MPPIKFQLNLTYGLGGYVVRKFSRWPPIVCLGSIWLRIREQMWFQDGHPAAILDSRRGGHLGQPNGTILAILNRYVAPMLPIKFQLNPTDGLGGNVVWRISNSWILKRNDLSISESLCCSDASHQVSDQSHMVWEKFSFEEFQDGRYLNVALMPPFKFRLSLTYDLGGNVVWRISRWLLCRPSWISEWNAYSNSITVMPLKFCHNPTYGLGGHVFWRISRWPHGGYLGYGNGTILAILNIPVATMPPTKFQLNPTYGSGGDVGNVKS